jgi:hypothetical protein
MKQSTNGRSGKPERDDGEIRFLMAIRCTAGTRQARLVIDSLRAFGGRLADQPVWIYLGERVSEDACRFGGDTRCFPLPRDEVLEGYPFGAKVMTCAAAEEIGSEIRSLVWLNLDCLIVQPPELFTLSSGIQAALRPVHIRNVGSLAEKPPDGYWEGVYGHVGLATHPYTVESFVDSQILRPYYNTHCFSIDPGRGLLRGWREAFREMILDEKFQREGCRDDLHRIFLHQAVFSTLIARELRQDQIRILPPEYSYPIHLQDQVPVRQRRAFLDRLVCAVYEERECLRNTEVREPLKSWLAEHTCAE